MFIPFIKSGAIYTKSSNFVFNFYLRIQFSMAIIVITIKDICEPEHVPRYCKPWRLLKTCTLLISRYQFNPMHYQTTVACQILLKALTNMPHTDFTLCKCLIDAVRVSTFSWKYMCLFFDAVPVIFYCHLQTSHYMLKHHMYW